MKDVLPLSTILQIVQLAIVFIGGVAAVQKIVDELRAVGVRFIVVEKAVEKLETRVERLEAEKWVK